MSFASLAPSETDQPRAPRPLHAYASARSSDPDEDALPLPTDDEVPQATITMLGEARDTLMRLVGAVFQAAIGIVDALLRLVQTVAGRDVAGLVDRGVAGTLDRVLPDLPAPRDTPAPAEPPAPASSTRGVGAPGPSASPVAERSASGPDGLYRAVHEILHTYARTDEERRAITPALVELVTTGAGFLLSVERRFPGAIGRLQAQDSEIGSVSEVRPDSATRLTPGEGASAAPQPAAQY